MSLVASRSLQIQKISFPLARRAQRQCLGLDQHYGLQSQIRWLNQKKFLKFFDINDYKYMGEGHFSPDLLGSSNFRASKLLKAAQNGLFWQFLPI